LEVTVVDLELSGQSDPLAVAKAVSAESHRLATKWYDYCLKYESAKSPVMRQFFALKMDEYRQKLYARRSDG
jgi:hypothetical protein